jgi:hypothetical protein
MDAITEAIISTNEMNTFSTSELNYVRDSVENMNKFNQIEILRILNNHKDVMLNENKYGIHVNLSELSTDILDELVAYIKYVNTQEVTLNKVEQQKEDFKNIYFTKDNKDNTKVSTR